MSFYQVIHLSYPILNRIKFVILQTLFNMDQNSPSISDQLGVILKRWQERLIDVSKSNPLLGLNRSRAVKLEIESVDINNVAKALLAETGSLKLPFVQKRVKKQLQLDEDPVIEAEEYLLHEGDINFVYPNLGDLRRKIRKIFDNSRVTMNERGVNTLYLALGCLEWSDAMMGKSESPLIMIPCEFEYKGASKPLGLVLADEDIILNPAIRYYLKEREEIDLPEIKPEDFSFEKIEQIFRSIEKLVAVNDWKVSERAWLGIFSFESLAIYQDLKLLDAQARGNAMVQAIAHLSGEAIENLHLDNDLDVLPTPEQVPIPVVQADSSQLRAMTLAAQGANVVIHGPPGTGKSQTITGIIANALAQNKKVLFVSSKMAALNVVHSRLQNIGLGQYCLEAHGVKSGKKKVVDELKRSLETVDEFRVAKNFNDELAKLVESRQSLNDYVKTLHDAKNALSMSVFNAFGVFEKLKDTPLVKAPLPWSDILQVSSQELEQAEEVLRELRDNAVLFSQKEKHPLKGMKSGGVDLSTQERLEQGLEKIVSFDEIVQKQIRGFSELFQKLDLTISDLFASSAVFEALSKIDSLPLDWQKKSVDDLEGKMRLVVECENLFQKKEKLKEKFHSFSSGVPEQVIEVLDRHEKKYSNWYSRISFQYLGDKKVCGAVLDNVNNISGSHVTRALNCARELIEAEKELVDTSRPILSESVFVDEDILGSLQYLQRKMETAISLKKWMSLFSVLPVENPVFIVSTSNSFSALVDVVKMFEQEFPVIQKDIDAFWPDGLNSQIKIGSDALSLIADTAKKVLGGLNQVSVRDWQIISRILERCGNIALLPFVQKLGENELTNALEIFRKRFFSLWIDATIHANQVLNEFSATSHADLINKYKILDDKVLRLNILNTIAAPAQSAIDVKSAHMGVGNSNGVGILRKEMEKKKGLKPLRILFNEIPQVLQALKPCFLMSPLSVSTFLQPGAFNFDLVIFDEASQLPTPEAIPSILRAKQVVVAGDSNQLPPSSFFRTNIAGESTEWEEGQVEELESLLDDCKASVPFFQETDLKWHYRSRDERLISFSNHYYYENKLITFPSPNTDLKKSGVILEYVPDGVWDRGGSRINRKEARRVAQLIVAQLKSEPEKTLGVVAFNSSQKEAIEDALEEELQNNKDLAQLIDPERIEAFFIKSLENVQGDERDVIIISVGYGKAQDGKMSLNFGPLNTEGGWRRLNVLVTRSKWKTILVTSVRASELVGINPENKGPVGLKNYIQYAETGFLNESREAPKLLAEETNDFEDSVRRELELRGFKVDAQIGVGSFRIDLAVRDPKNPTGYAIGIECDGASYHSSRSARDRDILRQEILQAMGWKFYRIWSTEWFKNREAAVNMLVENVNRAIKGEKHHAADREIKSDDDVEEDDSVVIAPMKKTQCGIVYSKARVKCSRELIMDTNKAYLFADVISDIVKGEGPIHVDLVLERIRELSGVARVGSNIQANFETAIRHAIKDGDIEKKSDDKGFLYKSGKQTSDFRTPSVDVTRRLGQISKQEIGNAIIFLIKDQFGLAYDNAVQSIKHVFGINRVDPEEADRVKDLIDEMVADGALVKHGPLLNLLKVEETA
jgi:very-short-patch-repair endonuclease